MTAQSLAVLAALGLTYCYVVSAPILTMHSLRAEIDFSLKKLWTINGALIALLSTAFGLVAYCVMKIDGSLFHGMSMIPVVMVLALQLVLIGSAARNRFARVTAYSFQTASERAVARPYVAEYVESYRHLREHGNSFMLVILVILFTMATLSLRNLQQVAILVFVWIAPAALTWLLGMLLESRLPEGRKILITSTASTAEVSSVGSDPPPQEQTTHASSGLP